MDKLFLKRVYGYVYFGSGGGGGRVRTINASSTTERKDGFVCGEDGFVPNDPTQVAHVWATGSDYIGRPRKFEEAYTWDPTQGWVAGSAEAFRNESSATTKP